MSAASFTLFSAHSSTILHSPLLVSIESQHEMESRRFVRFHSPFCPHEQSDTNSFAKLFFLRNISATAHSHLRIYRRCFKPLNPFQIHTWSPLFEDKKRDSIVGEYPPSLQFSTANLKTCSSPFWETKRGKGKWRGPPTWFMKTICIEWSYAWFCEALTSSCLVPRLHHSYHTYLYECHVAALTSCSSASAPAVAPPDLQQEHWCCSDATACQQKHAVAECPRSIRYAYVRVRVAPRSLL